MSKHPMRSGLITLRQAGFSLVELMIAMVLSLVLMGGVISVFVSSKQGYSTNTAVAQIQENARFALGFMSPVVRMAGYAGCIKGSQLGNMLNGGSAVLNFGQGIGGYEATGTNPGNTTPYQINGTPSSTPWSPTLDTLISGLTPVQGSDVLVIYGASSNPIPVDQFNDNNENFRTPFGTPTGYGLYVGEIGIVTDCVKGLEFQMTNTNGNHVEHSPTGAVSPGNGIVNPGGVKAGKFSPYTFGNGASLVLPDAWVYYIAKSSDGITTSLYQADLGGGGATALTAKELVSGIDNMQVLYGVDVNSSGYPTYYTTADNVSAAQWQNVVSVEISLLIESGTGVVSLPSTPPVYTLLGTQVTFKTADTRLRHVFTTTIALRNRVQ